MGSVSRFNYAGHLAWLRWQVHSAYSKYSLVSGCLHRIAIVQIWFIQLLLSSSNSSLGRHKFEQTLGDSGGQRSLACYSPWGHIGVVHDLMTKQKQFLTARLWGCKDNYYSSSAFDRLLIQWRTERCKHFQQCANFLSEANGVFKESFWRAGVLLSGPRFLQNPWHLEEHTQWMYLNWKMEVLVAK